MNEETLHKAPVVTVIIKTESDWEGNQESTVRKEFIERDAVSWPMIVEIFYAALRGYGYSFPEKAKRLLEDLSDIEYDWFEDDNN